MWIRHPRRRTVCNFKIISANFIEKMTFKQIFEEGKGV